MDSQRLEEVILPESIERVGERAFYSCYKLKAINIPQSVIYIGENAFAHLKKRIVEEDGKWIIYE